MYTLTCIYNLNMIYTYISEHECKYICIHTNTHITHRNLTSFSNINKFTTTNNHVLPTKVQQNTKRKKFLILCY